MKLEIEENFYCLEAVQKSAYRFVDRLTVLISRSEGKLVCEIEAIPGTEEKMELNVADFKRELIDQQLRKQIKDETETTRNLILSYAFSRSGLQG